MNETRDQQNYLSEPLWNTKQTAAYLNKKPNTLAKWIRNKTHDLRPIKIGRDVCYCPVYIREYVAKHFLKQK